MTTMYVPAGVELYGRVACQISVTFCKDGQKERSVFGKSYRRWHLHDRTVELFRAQSSAAPLATARTDIAVPIYCPSYLKSIGVTTALMNPIHATTFDREAYVKNGIRLIVDSGGFQMLKGTVDFVSPDDVAASYNRYADIGMPLDLPVTHVAEERVFARVSNMIRANDRHIEPLLAKGKHLALISHGTSLRLRKERLDVLGRPDAKVIAIAGLNILPRPGVNPYLSAIENLMYVVTRYRKTAQYFHVLGVTSSVFLFVYAILLRHRYVNDIGADSVSPRVSALAGSYLRPDFTTTKLHPERERSSTSQCGCPVCFSVRDLRPISECSLLESHNLWAYQQRVAFVLGLADDFIKGKTSSASVFKSLGLARTRNITPSVFNVMLKYINKVVAEDKFTRLLSSREQATLFSRQSAASTEVINRYETIIRRYEEWHGTKF